MIDPMHGGRVLDVSGGRGKRQYAGAIQAETQEESQFMGQGGDLPQNKRGAAKCKVSFTHRSRRLFFLRPGQQLLEQGAPGLRGGGTLQ